MSSSYEMVGEQAIITWQDCLNRQDELIETIKLKMEQDPEHGKLWQEKLALMLCRRQEILIKVEQEIEADKSIHIFKVSNVTEDTKGEDNA